MKLCKSLGLCIAALALQSLAGLSTLHAQASIITDYETFGLSGVTSGSIAPATTAANVLGVDLVRGSGLTATSASNAYSSSSWSAAAPLTDGDYLEFGFDVASGYEANLDSIRFATQASNTGPGGMALYYSGDSFTAPVASWTHTQGSYWYNHDLDLTSLTPVTGETLFRIVAQGTTSANGGTLAGTGTMRIGDYYDGSTYSNIEIFGEVVEATQIPEPGKAMFAALLAPVLCLRRKRA